MFANLMFCELFLSEVGFFLHAFHIIPLLPYRVENGTVQSLRQPRSPPLHVYMFNFSFLILKFAVVFIYQNQDHGNDDKHRYEKADLQLLWRPSDIHYRQHIHRILMLTPSNRTYCFEFGIALVEVQIHGVYVYEVDEAEEDAAVSQKV